MVTCGQNDYIVDTAQIRGIAESVKSHDLGLHGDITYEINGCILTWVAHHEDCEIRFECRSVTEIIDGYYKAEFFLDIKNYIEVKNEHTDHDQRMLDSTFTTYCSSSDSHKDEFEGFRVDCYNKPQTVPQRIIMESVSKFKNNNTSDKEIGASNYTLRDKRNTQPITKNDVSENFWAYEQLEKENKRALRSKTETLLTPYTAIDTEDDSKVTEQIEAQTVADTSTEPSVSGTISAIEDVQTDSFLEDDIPLIQPIDAIVEKRPVATIENSNVRRGKRIRKVSIFQDCYIPSSSNDWISEAFIGADKMNF